MPRLMIVTFGFLAWAFYEASGGDAFDPAGAPASSAAVLAAATPTPRPVRPLEAEIEAVVQASAPITTPLAPRPASAPERAVAAIDAPLPAAVLEPEPDIRTVTGTRVNMRNGPGTEYDVIGQLVQGALAEVIAAPGNGWLRIRTLKDQRVGWMAERLLAPSSG